jgi:pimeloyl-ACP methyl ester carboxylesterase
MKTLIIGIHGLANKPTQTVLEKWWRLSISEGLYRNTGRRPFFDFRLVYWADYINSEPSDPNEKDTRHPLYIAEPYLPSPGVLTHEDEKTRQPLKKKIKDQFAQIIMSDNFMNIFPAVTESAARKRYREIDLYYSPDAAGKTKATAQEDLRSILSETLFLYRRHRIVLIAHSMGSLIACDVLYSLDFSIDTFITIGSPLGIPLLMGKMREEHRRAAASSRKIKSPESISGQWLNLFDPRDKVGCHHRLSDFFAPNIKGVAPKDLAVENDYRAGDSVNPHKVYGYLRCHEISDVLFTLITKDKNRARLLVENAAAELIYRLNRR